MADSAAALHDRSESGPGATGPEPVRAIARILRPCAIVVGVAVLLWALSDAVLIIFLAILLASLLRGLAQELARFTRRN